MRSRNLVLAFIFMIAVLISIFIGRYQLTKFSELLTGNDLFQRIIVQIRLPRIVLAVVAGFSLAIAGQVMQAVFRNPLADPGIMGVSQAAGFGAAAGILFFGESKLLIQLFSFLLGLLALVLALAIAKRTKADKMLALLLGGIAVSALFSAGLGLLKYLADPIDQLPNIVFWLLGSMSGTNWKEVFRLLIMTLPIIIFFWMYRWRLNIHMLDKQVSYSLGLANNWELNFILIAAVFLTSSIISLTGIIGWVGLIIPNYARMLAGQNSINSLPFSAVLGGIFMLICDNFSRALLPGEIPIGIFTAFFGAFLFIGLFIWQKVAVSS